MLKRIRGRLTFANLAAAAALFVALGSGTALSLSSDAVPSPSIPPGTATPTACSPSPLPSPGSNRAVCTVGSLLVRAVCTPEGTGAFRELCG